MTKSKKQQEEEARAKAEEEAVLNDPGRSPSDVNKDSSASAPVTSAYQGGVAPRAVPSDEDKDK